MNLEDEMIALLAQEREMLLSGCYQGLEELADRKETLARDLAVSAANDAPTFRRISQLVNENAAMIEAARRGFLQAQRQLREIRRGMSQATYGENGQRQSLAPTAARMEQKL